MPILRFASPLAWPENKPVTPRTRQREDNGFSKQMTLADSIGYLEDEMTELAPNNATLSLDIEQPLVDRLRKKVGSRTGACLHIKYQNRPFVLTCDRWLMMEHNIYALHLTLRQWQNIVRWGVAEMIDLLAGFEANRTPEQMERVTQEGEFLPWMDALGLGPTATLDDAVAVYHRRAKTVAHDPEGLSRLNTIMDEARAHFAGRA